MTHQELIDELMALPDRIYVEEQRLIGMQHQQEEQRFLIKNREADLLGQEYGPITGKNEAVRSAQLHLHTAPERVQLLEMESVSRRQLALVEKLRNLLVACEAAARLMAG
jgi:hypothetical protein